VRLDQITLDELEDLAAGCGILGTGGGGHTYAATLMTRQALEEFGPVRLVDLDDLAPDGLIVPIGTIGAPTVGLEKLPSGTEARRLRAVVEERLGKPVVALMSIEIGGANGVEPVAFAAELGLPLLDADAMGRAFPEVPMVSMNVAGIPPGLLLMSDSHGNVATFEPIDAEWGERLERATAVVMGGSAIEVGYLMTPEQARGAIIEGTVSQAVEIGRALRAGEGVAGAIPLIEGKIVDVERRTAGGFARGAVTVEGTGDDGGRLLRIEIQNENLAAFEDGHVIACVPDLISLVDETNHAVPTELLRFGQRVTVIAMPCDPLWRTPRGLEIAGPSAFGYADITYVPVEESRVA
jgi:uncharacterized protein